MSYTILINENQKKILLRESFTEEFGSMVRQNFNFVKDVLKISSEQIGLNLQFLITWGASIGGFVGPLNEFINGKFPHMSDVEVSLLLTGIIATYYIDNKETVKKILDFIQERGLSNEFKSVLKKSSKLKETFVDFINSLNVTLHKVTNILSYAFIIPILPMLYEAANAGAFHEGDAKQIGIRLASFGVITVSGILIKELVSKLIRRFSGRH